VCPRSLTLADSIKGALLFRAGMLELNMDGAEFAAEMLALVDAVAKSSPSPSVSDAGGDGFHRSVLVRCCDEVEEAGELVEAVAE